jgi:hypothetical protein
MKLLMLFSLTLLSFNSYSQQLESTLEKLLQKYASGNWIKTDSVKQTTNLRVATFTTTRQMTNKRTGTKDSERGELNSNGLLIYYDIGFSAGAHMSMSRRKECTFYEERNFNNYKTCIGLINKDGKRELVVTIWGEYAKSPWTFPANFWGEIKDENDFKFMLEIVSSYKRVE